MPITPDSIWTALEQIRSRAPVVHNITNYVVMNTTANALLALGASPVMAHAEEEMRDMVGLASALVLNLGTLSESWIKSMFRAAGLANARRIPIVLDPVGAGATGYRTETARAIIEAFRPAIIRGNASEILALVSDDARTKGVDSLEASERALAAGRELNRTMGCAVCISGATDYIIDGETLIAIKNGHVLMTRVTGMGCTASALCGAFAAVTAEKALAAGQAMAVMGIAGEIAALRAAGPGSLQVAFLDALHSLDASTIAAALEVEN